MTKDKEKMMEKFAEIQKQRIVVYPVGMDSERHAHGYIVRDDRVWYVKDNTPVPIELE
ncbi:MAG: hypothetical protein JXA82_04270 [Sedimentisphaerales bacterium]|nr:hypothetical protein [Sedimentisphaerales bacterium]